MDDEPPTIPDRAALDRADAPMTVEERRLTRALIDGPLKPEMVSDEFRQCLMEVARSRRFRLTSAQRACLWRLGHKYRDLLPESVQSILDFRTVPAECCGPASYRHS